MIAELVGLCSSYEIRVRELEHECICCRCYRFPPSNVGFVFIHLLYKRKRYKKLSPRFIDRLFGLKNMNIGEERNVDT